MIKQITIDENNVVKAWSVGGYIENGVDVDDIPDYVMKNWEKYCYINGEYIENPDYIPPETTETITDTDVLNVLLGVNE